MSVPNGCFRILGLSLLSPLVFAADVPGSQDLPTVTRQVDAQIVDYRPAEEKERIYPMGAIRKISGQLRYEGQYTPPSVQGSLIYPGNVGVFNWGSVSVDPVRQLLFTSPNYMAFVSKMVPRAEVAEGSKRESETAGVQPNTGAPYAVTMHPFMSPLGVPCQAPAWGYVAGIDLLSNKVVWKHKNGTSRDSSPIPIGLPIGVPSMGGSMVTASGLGFLSGTLDQYLRAYDVNTGKVLWKARLPAGGQATPMTYTGKDGKQYVLVTAGGHGSLGTKMGDYIIAYKLPN